MAHFAKLDENNVVVQVDVLKNEVITDSDGVEQEQLGIDFLRNHYGEPNANWKQTSYNTHQGQHNNGGTPFRLNYAEIGGTYDPENDRFITNKPYSNFVGPNDQGTWDPPVSAPSVETYVDSDNNEHDWHWQWDNDNIRWIGRKSGEDGGYDYYWNPTTSSWDQI